MIFMMLHLVRTRRSRGRHAGWMKYGERRAANAPAVSGGGGGGRGMEGDGEGGREREKEGGREERREEEEERKPCRRKEGRKGRKETLPPIEGDWPCAVIYTQGLVSDKGFPVCPRAGDQSSYKTASIPLVVKTSEKLTSLLVYLY